MKIFLDLLRETPSSSSFLWDGTLFLPYLMIQSMLLIFLFEWGGGVLMAKSSFMGQQKQDTLLRKAHSFYVHG
jgi:hypothetical protein